MHDCRIVVLCALALTLGACNSCKGGGQKAATETATTGSKTEAVQSKPTPPPPKVPSAQKLSFAVSGGELNGKAFDITVPDTIGYWLYDPIGKNTMIAARGKANGYDVYFYAALPMKNPGIYTIVPGPSGADTRVQIRMRKEGTNDQFALLATEGQVVLGPQPGDWLEGTFNGKFVRSNKMGADLNKMPAAKRKYVQINGGSFAVSWKDRMGGRAQKWDGTGATAPAQSPSAPTPAKSTAKGGH